MATTRTVYVLSVIPRLAKLVQEKLPDVNIIEVQHKGTVEEKYSKKVYDEEITALQDAEVLLVDNNILAEISDKLPKVKWAQGTWAGVEAFLRNPEKLPAFPVSRMVSDTFSQLMAEYTVGWILIHEHGWLDCRHYQLKSEWQHTGKIAYYRSLKELTVGVLGMGNIGKEVARSLKAFHSEVHAFTRTVPSPERTSKNVDKYWHTGELHEFLGQCDYIVNIMPSTPNTRGMLGGNAFKHAKKDAVFINIGRGDVISEEDLIMALDAGWLSAAILDVFEVEPLSKESSLWKHPKVHRNHTRRKNYKDVFMDDNSSSNDLPPSPNPSPVLFFVIHHQPSLMVMLTPHSAGVSRAQDVTEAFLLNYKKFVSGQAVSNVIDWETGY